MMFRNFHSLLSCSKLLFVLMASLPSIQPVVSWSPLLTKSKTSTPRHTIAKSTRNHHDVSTHDDSELLSSSSSSMSTSRRTALTNMMQLALGTVVAVGTSAPEVTYAADTDSTATIYRTGKTPIVPGQKPKSKDDLKGTKKDPNFLRSIADCKNQCLNTPDADGLARAKEDCLSECQDICCTTYEQCTFAIVPRL